MVISDLNHFTEVGTEISSIVGGEDAVVVSSGTQYVGTDPVSTSSTAGILSTSAGTAPTVVASAQITLPEQVTLDLKLQQLLADLL